MQRINFINQLYKLSFIFLFLACAKEPSTSVDKKTKKTNQFNKTNLNISILLDLSDRIDTIKNKNISMEFYKRDVGYLESIADAFSNKIKYKKSRHLNDKIQLYFDPEPLNSQINSLSNELKIHVTNDNGTLEYINSVTDKYSSGALKIYRQALNDSKYVGSDTWGFFKNKVQDYCVDKDYRNILIIITDGYIFYEDSNFNEGNLSTYITPQKIRSKGLTKANWKEIIESKKHGFIPINQDLSDLEVLVLGVNPSNSKQNFYDYDILKKYWSDWLLGMGVKEGDFQFKMADLPSNMDKIIKTFIAK